MNIGSIKLPLMILVLILAGFYYIPRINLSCVSGDCYSGEGVYKYNNTVYTGSFEKGYRHGYGIEKYPGGCTYYGFFEEGHKQYYGTYVCDKDNYSFTTFWNHNGFLGFASYICGDTVYRGKWSGVDHKVTICYSGECEDGVGKTILPFKKIIQSGRFVESYLEGYGEEIDACTGKLLYKGKFIHSHRWTKEQEEAHQPVKGIDY
ncbi:hypothetical protein LEP1GSC047_0649 [Leptospira inadai serovar Lyme str. 10]|uniref:MORN repeat protein n=2 Tax=Leptospira inadai serovar Lyme TaxID=293084 RepID=V6HBP8_9LEPT|nr:hypothetical protein [Leptospira inadai]EQA37131.1 hypothetical protein LEP1GSC047_0649 [Leptospira inadai serovar Lyme str. 10]PNV76528.1 hypothetical protein BES34_002770 [Leptospira inadai serovar Lyme]